MILAVRYAAGFLLAALAVASAGAQQTQTPLAGADGRPSLFTAVEEQLGLRLEAATDAVDAIIVDSVEPPSPN